MSYKPQVELAKGSEGATNHMSLDFFSIIKSQKIWIVMEMHRTMDGRKLNILGRQVNIF